MLALACVRARCRWRRPAGAGAGPGAGAGSGLGLGSLPGLVLFEPGVAGMGYQTKPAPLPDPLQPTRQRVSVLLQRVKANIRLKFVLVPLL